MRLSPGRFAAPDYATAVVFLPRGIGVGGIEAPGRRLFPRQARKRFNLLSTIGRLLVFAPASNLRRDSKLCSLGAALVSCHVESFDLEPVIEVEIAAA
jgi:hypothetical protein